MSHSEKKMSTGRCNENGKTKDTGRRPQGGKARKSSKKTGADRGNNTTSSDSLENLAGRSVGMEKGEKGNQGEDARPRKQGSSRKGGGPSK